MEPLQKKRQRMSTALPKPQALPRLAKVPDSVMLGFAERIRQIESSSRKKVIDLSLGQPEVPAPNHISAAFQKSIEVPMTTYSSSAGSAELRTLIAERISLESGAQADADGVIITSGSKHALFISLLSLVDRDDEVLVFEPYFPPYLEIVELVGGKLKTVPINDLTPTRIRPDFESLFAAISRKTKVVLMNYPNNPAGWSIEEDKIKKIADLCSEKGIYLLSDEIYDKIVFDGRSHTSAWSFSADSEFIIKLGSFSKTYSMVPYRLGFLLSQTRISRELIKSQRATITMVSPYIQAAGVAAIRGPQEFVSDRLKKYQERRDRCLSVFDREGITVSKPDGTFYFFIKIPRSTNEDEFAGKLLEEEHVAVLPGSIFGERWRNYIRISFATKDSELDVAVEKISKVLSSHS